MVYLEANNCSCITGPVRYCEMFTTYYKLVFQRHLCTNTLLINMILVYVINLTNQVTKYY